MKFVGYTLLIVLLFSCNKDDADETQGCKLQVLTHGTVLTDQEYNIIYKDDLIVKMTGNEEEVAFFYDTNGYLAKREFSIIGDPQVRHRTTFKTNTSGQILETKRYRYIDDEMRYLVMETYEYVGSKLDKITYLYNDNISVIKTYNFTWTDDNPTLLTVTLPDGEVDYTTALTYDLTQENKLNRRIPYLYWFDFFETDFSIYQSLGSHVLTGARSTFDPDNPAVSTYEYKLLENGLVAEVLVNGDLWWSYLYECE